MSKSDQNLAKSSEPAMREVLGLLQEVPGISGPQRFVSQESLRQRDEEATRQVNSLCALENPPALQAMSLARNLNANGTAAGQIAADLDNPNWK